MQSIELRSDAYEPELNLIFEMVDETRHLSGDMVEIGSWKCGTSCMMARQDPKRLVYAFDIFGGMPPGVHEDSPWSFFANTDWDEIQATVKNFPNMRLVRGEHETTVPAFAKFQRPISLLFMDSDHYPSHKVSLENLLPLVQREGIVIFHDWQFAEVQQAVTEVVKLDEWKMLTGRDTERMGFLRKN